MEPPQKPGGIRGSPDWQMGLSPPVEGDCLLLGPRCVNQARRGKVVAWPCDLSGQRQFLSAAQRSGRRPLRRDRAMASVFKRVKEQVKEQAGKPENRRKLKEFGKRYIKRR